MRALWITFAILVVDQVTKTIVVHSMQLRESIPIIGEWFRLTFTTNPGMAFGITFGPAGMMPALAIIATFLIVAYMWKIRRAYGPYVWSLACILAGALGNIIDRVFYGIFYAGWGLFPGTGFFSGEVVDFLHFDIGVVDPPFFHPIPLWPIFNVADMAIVCGVVGVLITQKKFHHWQLEQVVAAELAGSPNPAEGLAVVEASGVPEEPVTASGEPPTRA